MNTIYTNETISPPLTRRMFFLGFNKGLGNNILHFPEEELGVNTMLEDNPFKVYQWLRKHAGNAEQYVVFCKVEWLLQDRFRLVRQMMAHPTLIHIPLIVLSDNTSPVPIETLMAHGIDDCYEGRVEWDALEARLEFLIQYKKKILATSKRTVQERFEVEPPVLKRMLDILGAVFGIIISAPIWILTAIAIRLESPGPILYRSKRVGTGYNVFKFWKFRSMYKDADLRLNELRHLNQYQGSDQVFIKLSADPRITRVGRFIRKYSIDELPQLLNVLWGDMSLVGNRPLPPYEAEMLTCDEWSARFKAPAGITGLWQVTKRGKSDMSTEERINLDITYAQNCDVWDDFRIMRRTFGAFIQNENV